MKIHRNHGKPERRERVQHIAQVPMSGGIVRRTIWCPRTESEDQTEATQLLIFGTAYFVVCLWNHMTDISLSDWRVPLRAATPREKLNYQQSEYFVLLQRVRTAPAI